ncbi:MAG: hypothetical protein II212_05475 [Alistipes sp.]|nr:hypothetical protein [Alistipes sp.]
MDSLAWRKQGSKCATIATEHLLSEWCSYNAVKAGEAGAYLAYVTVSPDADKAVNAPLSQQI